MKIIPLPIAGAFLIEGSPHCDIRGHFVRYFDRAEFAKRGLVTEFLEESAALNLRAGTIRGMHLQLAPAGETKLIRCTRGRAYDVLVDARPGSPTHGSQHAELLDEARPVSLYIPEGCLHGYQSLCDMTELSYRINAPYTPGLARGVRYDDPRLAIPWPLPCLVISKRDLEFSTFGTLVGELRSVVAPAL